MRRMLVGGITLAALAACTALMGITGARASETYEKATALKCEHCHKQTKEEFEKLNLTGYDAVKDLKECGTDSLVFLKKQPGFKPLKPGEKRTKAETKKWADALADEEWKCKHQSAPGAKVK
jgi:hypothetical protein